MFINKSLIGLVLILFTNFTWSNTPSIAIGDNAAVSSEHYLASQAGWRILAEGGNAIDAAVAIGYALGSSYFCHSGIGGGGFMAVHFADGSSTFINFREMAPANIDRSVFLEHDTINPHWQIAVPGSVLGFNTALEHYGTMSLADVMQPAIELARDGFTVDAVINDYFQRGYDNFSADPALAELYLQNGELYSLGTTFQQPALAHSLQLIAEQGSDVFYRGDIAEKLVRNSERHGGFITQADLANYTIEETDPIFCSYRNYDIIAPPPPSSGGVTVCQILKILSDYPMHLFDAQSAAKAYYFIEAARYAYRDRNHYLGDPNFVDNPIDTLLSDQHNAPISAQFTGERAGDSLAIVIDDTNSSENLETTHYSVVDSEGNVVVVTFSLNGFCGAKVTAEDTGFLLNNTIDDFTTRPGEPNMFGLVQGEANAIEPYKRPLSSMTPIIVLKDGEFFMTLGGPGGSMIITSVLQALLNVIDHDMSFADAISAPRFHHQWLPDVVTYEDNAFTPQVVNKLGNMGYDLISMSPAQYSLGYVGWVNGIMHDSETGRLTSVVDWRRPSGLALAD